MVYFWKTVLSVFLALGCLGDDQDVFSSTAELAMLARQEQQFVRELEALATGLEEEAGTVRRFLARHYSTDWSGGAAEEYVSHPVNSLALVARLSHHLDRSGVPEVLSSNSSETTRRLLANLSTSFPTHQDWEGATNGIFLLQEHYSLEIAALAEGVIVTEGGEHRLEGVHSLQAEEILQIGISSINAGYFDVGVEWLELAQRRLAARPPDDSLHLTADMANIAGRLREARQIHDHALDHRGVVSGSHRCHRLPYDSKLARKKKFRGAREANRTGGTGWVKREVKLVPLFSEDLEEKGLRENFEELCKGESLRTPAMDGGLLCRLLHHRDPFSRLGPFLLEEASLQPYLVVIKGLMEPEEMAHFKEVAVTQLERSGHGGGKGPTGSQTSLKRTSKQTWLEHRFYNFSNPEELMKLGSVLGTSSQKETEAILVENNRWASFLTRRDTLEVTDRVVARVSDRIGRATTTQLHSPISAEQFQVANYGLGGQYSQHLDPHGHWEGRVNQLTPFTGDRLMTVMVYLSQVEAGGATTFPLTGNRVEASQGDAVVWVSLRTSGLTDRLTFHGGCPVLVGSKWITNKWVGYLEQWRSWPCSAKPGKEPWKERFQPFTDHY